MHQDQAGWGDAVTEAAQRRDIKMMKEAGFDLSAARIILIRQLFHRLATKKVCSFGQKLHFGG